jgi:hypothetical protein
LLRLLKGLRLLARRGCPRSGGGKSRRLRQGSHQAFRGDLHPVGDIFFQLLDKRRPFIRGFFPGQALLFRPSDAFFLFKYF